LEEADDGDLHSNASCSGNRIEINQMLLEHHDGHVQEILAILCHELGHWKEYHLYRSIPIDTMYMVIFALFLMPLVNNHILLASFGFKQESYIMSVMCAHLIFSVSFDWFA